MGPLDDAIREHLELKRRRGADPDEVTRQENEALGAARRAEFARPEGAEDAPEAEAADEAPFDAGDDEPVAEASPEVVAPEPTEEPERESFDIEASEPAPAPVEPATERQD